MEKTPGYDCPHGRILYGKCAICEAQNGGRGTPGPWDLDRCNGRVFVVGSDGNSAIAKILGNRPGANADAALIAAAPELLVALKGFFEEKYGYGLAPTYDELKELLARAEGGAA